MSSNVDLNSILSALGMTSGFNVPSIVNNLIYAQRTTERQWQAQQADIKNQQSYLDYFDTLSGTLSDKMNSLQDPIGGLTAMTATSSQSNLLSVSAAAGTATGTHVVKIANLASTGAWYSDSAASATTTLAAGTFSLTVSGGSPKTIEVGNGINTLQGLADYINGQSFGVSANIVTDSNGARLALISKTSGAAGDFSLTASPSLTFAQQPEAWYSSYSATSSTKLNSGSFDITVGAGSPVKIQVGNGVNTLDDLASNINGRGLGVTATVVTDGNGTRLSLVSDSTNDSSGFYVAAGSGLGFTQAAQGKNASLTVDGIPISSATNTVDGAVSGLTLNLLGAAPNTEITVSVTRDVATAKKSVSDFVDAYNTLVKQVNAQFKYSQSTDADGNIVISGGALSGDSAARMFQADLLSLASYSIPGYGAYSSLGALGINMQDDGTMEVDSTKLDAALNSNFSAVQTFFQGTNSDGFAHYVNVTLDRYTDSTEGAFTIDVKTLTSQYDSLQNEIDDFETYIAGEQKRLTDYYNNVNVQLQQMTAQVDQIKSLLDPGSKDK